MSPAHESRRLSAVQSPIIPVIADLIRSCPGTISLGQGVVYYGPPPEATAQLAAFLAESANHKYQPVGGIPALVAAIEKKLAAENQMVVGPDSRVIVTAGGNMAFINAVLAIADPGDEIILPTPYYFNQEMAITMAGCRPVLAPTDADYQLQPEAIRAAITPRTRAVVTVSPNNPTGAVYSPAALREVNRLCGERGIFHISDEAYEYFTYDDARHFSPGSVAGSAGHTISLFSLSKAFGFASWRIGWMVIPARLESAVRKIQDTIVICPPVISQFAAIGALQAGRGYAEEKLGAIAELRGIAQEALRGIEGCAMGPAQGAFYLLVRLATPAGAMDVARRLIQEHRVAVIPGNAFGLLDGCHLRVAYGALPRATTLEGIERLQSGLRALLQK
jgi:aspartate/methionine/tyrosine aminotransferase